jgi:hypothetical protein
MGTRAVCLVLGLLASGCSCAGARGLAVDLKTDFVPGEEFGAVRTEVYAGLFAEGAVPVSTAEAFSPVGVSFVAGRRVADFSGIDAGDVSVRVVLLDRMGAPMAEGVTRLTLREGANIVTVVISRACSAGAPGCVPMDCTAATECAPPTAACAEAMCVDGLCLYAANDAACGADEYCSPESGCLTRTPADAGVDGGGDAGAAPACLPTGAVAVDRATLREMVVMLPAAGSAYVDPVFGSTVVRLTDGGSSRLVSSDRTAFNADTTRLLIVDGGQPVVYGFDPATGGAVRERVLGRMSLDGEAPCVAEDAVWSRTDPNVIFCHETYTGGRIVYAYDVTVPEESALIEHVDIGRIGDPGKRLGGMRISDSGDVLGFYTRNSGGNIFELIGFDRRAPPGRVRSVSAMTLDAELDASGRWFLVTAEKNGDWTIWDWTTDTVMVVPTDGETRAGSCEQWLGYERIFGLDCTQNGLLSRTFTSPEAFTASVDFPDPYAVDVSLDHRGTPAFAIVSTHSASSTDRAAWGPFEQEILAVALDGSFVLRLAHHHSHVRPEASISYRGDWIAFTSDFDGGGSDVFAMRAPPRCP